MDRAEFSRDWFTIAQSLPTDASALLREDEQGLVSLAGYGDSYAPTSHFERLKSSGNHVLFGRRGTGKTHLLRSLQDHLVESFEEQLAIPLYIDGRKIGQRTYQATMSPEFAAFRHYVAFLKEAILDLWQFIDRRIQPNVWDRLVQGDTSRRKTDAVSIAKELYDLVSEGNVLLLPAGQASTEAKSLSEISTGFAVGAGLSSNVIAPSQIGFALSGGAEQRAERSKVQTITIAGEVVLPYEVIVHKLRALVSVPGRDTSVVVLFDEWSSIDQDPAVQPFLADLLKRTFNDHAWFSLKLACVTGRTRLTARPRNATGQTMLPIGLELGNDADSLDLDEVVFAGNNLRHMSQFMCEILRRQLSSAASLEPPLSREEFDRFVTDEMFADWASFEELMMASAGLPRRFLQIYKEACARADSAGETSVDVQTIRYSARDLHERRVESEGDHLDDEIAVLDAIYSEFTAKRDSNYLLLTKQQERHAAIRGLWEASYIHRMAVRDVDDDGVVYRLYSIDYGVYADLIEKRAKSLGMMMSAALYFILKWLILFAGSLDPKSEQSNISRVVGPSLAEDNNPPSGLADYLAEREVKNANMVQQVPDEERHKLRISGTDFRIIVGSSV